MKSNFFSKIKNNKNNKFNKIILTSETVEPITIEIGKNENNNKKKFSLFTRPIKKASTL